MAMEIDQTKKIINWFKERRYIFMTYENLKDAVEKAQQEVVKNIAAQWIAKDKYEEANKIQHDFWRQYKRLESFESSIRNEYEIANKMLKKYEENMVKNCD